MGLRVAVAAMVVAAVAATAVALGSGRERRGPDAALAAAQAVVRDAASFRFTVEDELTWGDGSSTRGTVDGAWSSGRWRLVAYRDQADEYVSDETNAYWRTADDVEGLEAERWTSGALPQQPLDQVLDMVAEYGQDDDDESRDSMAAFSSVYACLGPGNESGASIAVDPRWYLEGVQKMSSPTVVAGTDAALTLATTFEAPAAYIEAFGRPLPACALELDLDADDRPTALRVDTAQGSGSYSMEVRFSDWDVPVDITVPPPVDVDPVDDDATGDAATKTPEQVEEGLDHVRTVPDIAPLYPRSLPEGWELVILDAFPLEELYEPDELSLPATCTALNIEVYGDGDLDTAWLSLQEFTSECALLMDDTPFEPGGPAGLEQRELGDGTVQYRHGDTVLDAASSLEGAEYDALLASLAPIDVDALVDMAAAVELAEQT